MRCFMTLAYRGSGFHGWQTQPNAATVQQTLEEVVSKLLRQKTDIVGAGRTDTDVNARMMVAHLDIPDIPAMPLSRMVHAINTQVGHNIAVSSIVPLHPTAHARFDATARTYRYFVSHRKDPFRWELSWFCPRALDYERMNEAAATLCSVDDFTSFAKLHSDAKTNICHVSRAVWTRCPHDPDMWQFEITADRFLRNMVRAVVGTLVEVGRGKLSVDGFRDITLLRDRCAAGTSMPGYALFLWDIKYPYPISPESNEQSIKP